MSSADDLLAQLLLGIALAESAKKERITETAVKIDRDGDFLVLFETNQHRYAIVVKLRDAEALEYKECQAICSAMKIAEKGTEMNNNMMQKIAQRLGECGQYFRVSIFTENRRLGVLIVPGTARCQMPFNGILPPSFLVTRSGSQLESFSVAGMTRNRFYFIFRLDLKGDTTNGFAILSKEECNALKDIVYLSETGDPLDEARFRRYGSKLKERYANTRSVRFWLEEANVWVYICRIAPRVTLSRAPPIGNVLRDASVSKNAPQPAPPRSPSASGASSTPPHSTSYAYHPSAAEKKKGSNTPGSPASSSSSSSVSSSPSSRDGKFTLNGQALQYDSVTFENKLVSSGQAVVYSGKYKAQQVAIKVFKDTDQLEEWKQEVRALIRAGSHPNIINILDFSEKPLPCIVMNFIKGGDLSNFLRSRSIQACHAENLCTFGVTQQRRAPQQWMICHTCAPNNQSRVVCVACAKTCHQGHALEEKTSSDEAYCNCGAGDLPGACKNCGSQSSYVGNPPLSNADALKIIYGIAKGLAHLHASGIVHRDVKPSNILLDGLRPIIIDMGFGRKIEDDSRSLIQTVKVRGTYLWMAPEMISSATYCKKGKSDVYAFGVTFWQILSGRTPYCDNPPQTEFQHQINVMKGGRPNIKFIGDDRPQWMIDLMCSCWKHKRSDRPTMAQIVSKIEANREMLNTTASSTTYSASSSNAMDDIFDDVCNNGMDFKEFCDVVDDKQPNMSTSEKQQLFSELSESGSVSKHSLNSYWEKSASSSSAASSSKSSSRPTRLFIAPDSTSTSHSLISDLSSTGGKVSGVWTISKWLASIKLSRYEQDFKDAQVEYPEDLIGLNQEDLIEMIPELKKKRGPLKRLLTFIEKLRPLVKET